MKIAVSGKGGVGKTTLTSLLCNSFQKSGYSVFALDADPDANLAATLGFPEPGKIVPVVEMKELIEERTGVKPGSAGAFFKINPRVDDIPERFSVTHNGIRLLVMGKVKKAGTGCYCPENAFIRELVGHLLLKKDEVVIMDMEAGVEHIGRGTAYDVDVFIIVVEPGKRSLETAQRIVELIGGLGVKEYSIIVNKVRCEDDRAFVENFFPAEKIIGTIGYSDAVARSGKEDTGIDFEDMTQIDLIIEELMKGEMNG